MGGALGFILILGSLLTFIFVIVNIRKSTIRIEDTIFWILFCILLVILSVFPSIAYTLSNLLGFQSPINMVYLIIIFILLVHQFYMSLKLSRLLIKQKELTQAIALQQAMQQQDTKSQGDD